MSHSSHHEEYEKLYDSIGKFDPSKEPSSNQAKRRIEELYKKGVNSHKSIQNRNMIAESNKMPLDSEGIPMGVEGLTHDRNKKRSRSRGGKKSRRNRKTNNRKRSMKYRKR